MSEKDFLSQFSKENIKPESFKVEERIPVRKEKKPVNKGLLIGILSFLLVILAACYFLFLAPKIVMPDFIGKDKNDVAAWVKQQGIESSGIIFEEEYDFESDEGTVLYQSIEEGKKVREDVKLNFTISLGANPDEKIEVPDIANMEKSEIQEWIEDNKLTKTKITTSYSDTVAENKVISFEYSGCDEDSFTRSSTLKISISKGAAPAGTVTLEDFKDKTYAYVETWAKNKKILLNKSEQFSDTVSADFVITQSIDSGKTMKEGETLEVVISKGAGVEIPDFNSLSKEEVNEWLNKYSITVKEKYSDSASYIVEQNIVSGSMVSLSELSKLTVVKNLGSTFYLADEGFGQIVGMNYNELEDLCNSKRNKGIDAYAANWVESNEEYSYIYKRGQIVSVRYTSHSTGQEYYENDRMPLDIRFNVSVSKGLISVLSVNEFDEENSLFNTRELIDELAEKGISFVNEATGDHCRLKINGSKLNKEDLSVTEEAGIFEFEIKETDSVTLIN